MSAQLNFEWFKPISSDNEEKYEKIFVFCHGFLGSGRNLRSIARKVLEESSANCNALMLDLPGHGKSSSLGEFKATMNLNTPINLDLIGRILSNYFENNLFGIPESVSEIIACGHSLGGRSLLSLINQSKFTFHQLILMDISPSPTFGINGFVEKIFSSFLKAPEESKSKNEMREFLIAQNISKPLVEWLLMNLKKTNDMFTWRVNRKELQDFWFNGGVGDFWHLPLDNTYILKGESSNFVSQVAQEKAKLKNIPIITIEHSGHFIHVDNSNQVVSEICQITA